jgi:hypothetical protein
VWEAYRKAFRLAGLRACVGRDCIERGIRRLGPKHHCVVVVLGLCDSKIGDCSVDIGLQGK